MLALGSINFLSGFPDLVMREWDRGVSRDMV